MFGTSCPDFATRFFFSRTHEAGSPQLFLRYTAAALKLFSKENRTYMSAKAVEAPEVEANSSDFQSLEEKIYRTIELLKAAREAKSHAERDAKRLREQLEESEEETDVLRTELVSLRKEREEVRTRVEKMLKQIDVLTDAESES
jgi:hypothetical protein